MKPPDVLRRCWPVAAWMCAAWSGYDVEQDGLRFSVFDIGVVTNPAAPVAVSVTVSNGRPASWTGEVRIEGLVDDWRPAGPATARVQLPASASTSLSFSIVSGPFVFDALYPVHARLRSAAAREADLQAVRIFEVRRPQLLPPARSGDPPLPLPPDRVRCLWLDSGPRFGWIMDGGAVEVTQAPGWRGSDAASGSSFDIRSVDRGTSRPAVVMHVPYRGGTGRCWTEWTVELPPKGPIVLFFATALAHPGERADQRSDGVRHRVLVRELGKEGDWTVAFEELCIARQWSKGRVDLSVWAGRTIRLRLENDPGPRRNSSFDLSAWAEPVLAAGRAVEMGDRPRAAAPQPADTAAARSRAEAVAAAAQAADDREAFFLKGGAAPAAVVVETGRAGLLDGRLAVAVAGAGSAACAGLEVDIENRPAGRWPSSLLCLEVKSDPMPNGGVRLRHRLADERSEFDLLVTLRADGPAFRMAVECPRRITRLRFGAWDRPAARSFWGHGYVVADPGPFTVHAGGHGLATSHVGFEFAGGPAVVEAVDVPPNSVVVHPDRRVFTIESDHNTVLTLTPARTAMDGALTFRTVDRRPAAPAVPRLAGRFVFDIWGGRFREIRDHMVRMAAYGLTNACVIIHNWQRWGYDYRLPDIWPPNPAVGSIDELRQLGDFCRSRGILWGLHDNYIDFYPDAKDYSYRRVYFTSDGRPHRAWYNESRDALSYKWRPDAILPFVERNYRLITANVKPTLSFVDVFASQPCGDWYDHEGRHYPAAEMRRHWGTAFDHIREALKGAPTTSEAGHDHLVGHLDGADCQWLRLTAERGAPYSIHVPCGAWTRVPWHDAVLHDRFILYGAGYSSRFEGGRGRAAFGINSDEYLAAEVLTGHPPMTDAGSWGAAAVRKYWLLADAARALALRRISGHEFVDGRIDHQMVVWDNGAHVWINLGSNDWSTAGTVLPPNGWKIVAPGVTAAVERIGLARVEWSATDAARYLWARTRAFDRSRRRLRIEPTIESARVDGRNLRYVLRWECGDAPGRSLTAFVHFLAVQEGEGFGPIVGQDDHRPDPPTDTWNGTVRYERSFRLPDDWRGQYRVMVGLFDRRDRRLLTGVDDGEQRIWVGTIRVSRQPDGAPTVTLEAPRAVDVDMRGLNPEGTMVDVGWAATDGGVRLERASTGWILTPLPDSAPFEVRLRWAALGGARARSLRAEMDDGQQREVAIEATPEGIRFRHNGEARAYRIEADAAESRP